MSDVSTGSFSDWLAEVMGESEKYTIGSVFLEDFQKKYESFQRLLHEEEVSNLMHLKLYNKYRDAYDDTLKIALKGLGDCDCDCRSIFVKYKCHRCQTIDKLELFEKELRL